MKKRGIIFTGEHVRKVLADKKTQTRRLVTPRTSVVDERPVGAFGFDFLQGDQTWVKAAANGPAIVAPNTLWHKGENRRVHRVEPRIRVGDRLWVRETWSSDCGHVYPCPPFWYRADFNECDDPVRNPDEWEEFRWRPSIHMPRRASRITLEVTDVRVERLQAITEADARAEGVDVVPCVSCNGTPGGPYGCSCCMNSGYEEPAVFGFEALWDSINAKRASWESNPWVWVIGFRRVEG